MSETETKHERLDYQVQQMQVLREAVESMIARSDQLFKLQEQRVAELEGIKKELIDLREQMELSIATFQASIGDLDRQTDALIKATAALLQLQVEQQKQ